MTDPAFVQLSLPPILIGTLAAIACALPGNFLLLRRQAMVGDAVSHAVLPGIVVAFLLTGQATGPVVLFGAVAAALLAVLLIEALRRFGRVEPGAAMAVVFSTMFAAGVVLIEQSGAGAVHLDVEHALMGNLESLIWFDATGWGSLVDPVALAGLPLELPRLALAAAVLAGLMLLFWRPLVLSTFDETQARAAGWPVGLIGLGLAAAAAVAAVAAFAAVGAIIAIAMFVCPPATARLLTDRLRTQVWLSVGFATLAAVAGYVLAGHGPGWFGASQALSAAGMIATVAGGILAAAAIIGPRRRQSFI